MSENNPYSEGDPNWISFEWDKLCAELKDRNEKHDLSMALSIEEEEKAAQRVEEITLRMTEFKKLYFPD